MNGSDLWHVISLILFSTSFAILGYWAQRRFVNYRNELKWLNQQDALSYILEKKNGDYVFKEAYGKLFGHGTEPGSLNLKGMTLNQLAPIFVQEFGKKLILEDTLDDVLESGRTQGVVHTNLQGQSYCTTFSRYTPFYGNQQIIATVVEITFQKQIEDALRQEREHMKKIMDKMSDYYLICDHQLHVKDMSDTTRNIFHPDDLDKLNTMSLLDLPIMKDIAPAMRQNMQKMLETGSPVTFEIFSQQNGKWYENTLIPIDEETVFATRDITTRKKEQQALERMSQLDLLGNMAAGIAHEIRNPITTVSGFIQLMAKDERYSDMQHLPLILSEIQRADQIIYDFLALSKTKVVKRVPHSLNDILISLRALMESYALLNQHKLVMELDPNLPALMLNDGEIRQLVLNIVRNGYEAMDQKGTITIKTLLDETKQAVDLVIRDQGKGIPEEILDQVLTPLFTTKEFGMGLGLSVCQRVAERHDAEIMMKSSPKGTVITIRFSRNAFAPKLNEQIYQG